MQQNKNNKDFDKNQISELNKLIKKTKKNYNYLTIFGVIGVLIGFFALTSNVLDLTKEKNVVNDSLIKSEVIIKENESLLSKIDSLRIAKENITLIVKKYFATRNTHNLDSLGEFYADTLSNYFLLKNVSRKTILKEDRIYWNRYKEDEFTISEPIEVYKETNFFKAIIKGRQCRDGINCINELIEIHINQNNKIIYARAYYAKD